MKRRICGLAFILVGSLNGVGSAESPTGLQARSAKTPVERIGHVVMPNITPDPETGIGNWTDTEIVVALRDGKRPDGSIIGPPMPIPVYRQLSDHDAEAIAAYLRSLKPVKNALTRSQYKIPLPPNYGSPITLVEEPVTTDKVAYGGYLVGFGHCVLCHTPPGDGKPFNMNLAYSGGREFPRFGQIAPSVSRNITPDPEQGIGSGAMTISSKRSPTPFDRTARNWRDRCPTTGMLTLHPVISMRSLPLCARSSR